jgi:RNA polymerase sigma factor (sigma-70 family)
MASASFGTVYRYLRGSRGATPDAEPTDRQLLRRFARGRDEAAFATLVSRHGPLVMGVCRRVLGNAADAEDAFQATFLVLARRARFVAWRASVANWLHVTAYRLAGRMRLADSRRRARERRAAPKPEPSTPASAEWRELCELLDGELRRLPGSERAALLACYFEGRTQDEAARELGVSLRTLQRRLERGRELLRASLVRKGLPLPVAFLAGVLLNEAAAAGKAAETARAAVLFTTGGAPTVRSAVTTLAVSVLKSNARGLYRVTVAGLLVLGLCAAGIHFDFLAAEDEEEPLPTPASSTAVARPLVDAAGDPLPEGAVSRLGSLRQRHPDAVTCTAFCRDGMTVVSGDHSGRVILWDVDSGWKLREISSPLGSPINSVAVTPEGKTLVSWGGRGRVYVFARGGIGEAVEWPVEKLPEPRAISLAGGRTMTIDAWPIRQFTLSPDGKTLAVDFRLTEPILGVYDIATGKKRLFLELPDEVVSRAFTPDGNTLASGFRKGPAVRVWDLQSGNELAAFPGLKNGQPQLAFSPDGKTLAAAEHDDATGQKTLCVWDVATRKERWREKGHGRCASLAYHPDGTKLVTTESSLLSRPYRLTLRDAANGAKLFSGEPDISLTGGTLSPDGKTLAINNGALTFSFCDTTTGKLRESPGHTAAVVSMAFSPDGKRLVSTDSGYDRVRIWDPETGQEVAKPDGPFHNAELVFSPDGELFAGFDPQRHAVYMWGAADGKKIGWADAFTSGAPRSVCFGAGGRMMVDVVWNGKTARVWDVPKREPTRELEINQDRPAAVAMSPGGSVVAAGGYNGGTVRRWNGRTGWELKRIATPHKIVLTLAIAAGGKTMATGGEGEPVYLWDTQTHEQLHRLDGLGSGSTQHLSFTTDGRLLLGVGGGRAHVWDVASGKEVERFDRHDGPVKAAALSPDGRFAATACTDATILVWDLTGSKSRREELSPGETERLWSELADADDRTGYRAAGVLAAVPRQATTFLAARLRPAPVLDERAAKKVASLLAELDDDTFDVREKANVMLRELGPVSEPLLRRALEAKPSAEMRRRLEEICERFGEETPDWRRTRRALRVLERVQSPEARRFLEELAGGAPDARLTREAKAIRERMGQSP